LKQTAAFATNFHLKKLKVKQNVFFSVAKESDKCCGKKMFIELSIKRYFFLVS